MARSSKKLTIFEKICRRCGFKYRKENYCKKCNWGISSKLKNSYKNNLKLK